MKGADVVMAGIVQYNDWLEEEVNVLFIFWVFMTDMVLFLLESPLTLREAL